MSAARYVVDLVRAPARPARAYRPTPSHQLSHRLEPRP